jgi:hypothetical protein
MIRGFALLLLFAADEGSELTARISESGRVIGIADSPSERVAPPQLISPGAAPVLSFRGFDASDRGRLSGMGLMTDDAGH